MDTRHLAAATPTPSRRTRLRAVAALALAAGALAGCGAAHGAAAAGAAQAAADQAVRDGLVGAVYVHLTTDTRETGTAGQRRIAPATPLAGTERMMLESCSKAMTGMVAGRIVDRGLIAWTTTLAAAFPDLTAMRPEYRSVTLEQLLAHRGGVAAFTATTDVEAFLAALQAYPGTLPTDETGRRHLFVDWLLQQAPPAQVVPGSTQSYSNAGFAVAAAMLEAATGKGWETLFQEELLAPLGLTASFGAPGLLGAAQSIGYTGPKGQPAPADLLPADQQLWWDVLKPAGGVAMTPDEYSGWLRWHLEGLKGQATPLPAGYLDRLRAVAEGAYAVGWGGTTAVNGRRRVSHAGAGAEGYMSAVELFLDGGDADFALTNTFAFDDATGSSWVLTELLTDLIAMRGQLVR